MKNKRRRRRRRRKILKAVRSLGRMLVVLLAVLLLGSFTINIFKEKSSPETEMESSSAVKEEKEETKEKTKKEKKKETKKETEEKEKQTTETSEGDVLKPYEGYLYEPSTETEEISSTVIITPESDKTEETSFLQFPCEISGYDLIIEKLGSYSGAFVEDGTNEEVSETAMIRIKNNGDRAIEYAEITLHFQDDTLYFKVSALPAGECLIAIEQERKGVPNTGLVNCKATVIEKESMEKEDDKISVVDQGNDLLTVQNLTGQKIPAARIFYKYYLEEEQAYLGGIAFTVKLTDLDAKAKVTVQPSHFESKNCKIVMTTVYGERNE